MRTPSGARYLQDTDLHLGNKNYVFGCAFMWCSMCSSVQAHMSVSLIAGVTGGHLGVDSQTPPVLSILDPPLHISSSHRKLVRISSLFGPALPRKQ